MLPEKEYLQKFDELQKLTVEATEPLIQKIVPGQSEKQVADMYYKLLEDRGFTEHWYPILVYSGEITGKPISRKIHLPSDEVKIKKNDIVFVDSTPMKDTVWTNWCSTFVVGKNDFFGNVIRDVKDVVEKTASFSERKAKTVSDLYNYCTALVKEKGMEMLDPYKDVGHSIFQVPEHQTVDKTPMEDRLLLNQQFGGRPLSGIISIEPQLGRINPADGKMYGAKIQKVLIF